MMLRRTLLATLRVMLMIALGLSLTVSSGLAEPPDGTARGGFGSIHADCLEHRLPRFCSHIIAEILEELDRFNGFFAAPDADRLAEFYHEDAILFVGSTGRFFRGREAIRNEFFVPLVAEIIQATVDVTAFRFQVLSANLIIVYGAPMAVVTFKDGSTVTLPPLPQTLTWVRQYGNRTHPFVILADHE